MNKTISLHTSHLKNLKKCLQETIINNNIILSKCDFSDEEDLVHWDYINDYNENLKEILKMLKENNND